jgi:hypothetical protein
MDRREFKKKILKNFPLFLGIMGATMIGFIEGIGVEEVIVDQLIKSIKSGNFVGFMAYCGIFFLIWVQVRGLKSAVEKLNTTIANSFAKGETRFSEIEHRISVLEHNYKGR